MRSRSIILGAALASVIVAVGSAARAQSAPCSETKRAEAGQEFERARGLEANGHREEAAKALLDTYAVCPDYRVLESLGNLYVGMGRTGDAVDAYERYLREGGSAVTSEARARVEGKIKQLKPPVVEPAPDVRPAVVTFDLRPAGAAVVVDGKRANTILSVPQPRFRHIGSLVLGGVALALGGAGIGLGLHTASEFDDTLHACQPGCTGASLDAVRREVVATNVVFVAAGAAAIASVSVFLFVEKSPRVSVSPAYRGATVAVRF